MAESEPVTWLLAPSYLAAGKVNLLVGAEGIGKSLWTIRAMASVSTGSPWGPFTIAGNPGAVILIATEDGWSDTIRPRLELAEADLSRIYPFSEGEDGTSMITFPHDMDALNGACHRAGVIPSLVVVDAWIDTVHGGLEVKDPQKARRAVAPWKEFAANTGAAVLLVTHTNRGEHQNLRNTYGLSGALRQAARSALYAAEDPDTGSLLVGPEKSNLGAKADAQRFAINAIPYFPKSAGNDGTVPLLSHLGSDGRTIAEAVAGQNAEVKPERKTEAIDAWLRTALATGSVTVAELAEQALENGYSTDQLRRAKNRVGTRTVKVGGQWRVQLAV
jgi:hypothetical protein